MSKTTTDYLLDMLRELDDVQAYTRDGRLFFQQDSKTQKAVIRCYEVIGEIAKRIPQSVQKQHKAIDWTRLINFRDFLAHNYDKVAARFLWDAVEDVPNLRGLIEQILETLSD